VKKSLNNRYHHSTNFLVSFDPGQTWEHFVYVDRVNAATPESADYCVPVLRLINQTLFVWLFLQGLLSTQELCEKTCKFLKTFDLIRLS
jgi:hypothetical protein